MNRMLTGRTTTTWKVVFALVSCFVFIHAPTSVLAITPAGKYLVKVKTGNKKHRGIFIQADSSGIELRADRTFGQFLRGKPAINVHINKDEIRAVKFRRKSKFYDYMDASRGLGLLGVLIGTVLAWVVPILSLVIVALSLILMPIMMGYGWLADEKISIDHSEEKYYQSIDKMNRYKF